MIAALSTDAGSESFGLCVLTIVLSVQFWSFREGFGHGKLSQLGEKFPVN